MKILTLENKTYILEKIPEYVDDKLRFAVLDNSNPADPDYYFIQLIFLESFNAPAAVLQIGVPPLCEPGSKLFFARRDTCAAGQRS